jgi:sec-independent protein translocase protein TatA
MIPTKIGAGELVIILLIIIMIFGASRLREIGGAMGGAIREFRSAVSGTDEEKSNGEKEKEEEKEA